MRDTIFIFWFFFIFLMVIGILYSIFLMDKKLEKRLNYYLNINEKYKKFKDRKGKPETKGNLLKKCSGFIRSRIKGDVPNEKQREINQMLMGAGVNLKPEEYIMLRWFLVVILGGILYLVTNNFAILILGAVTGYIYPKIWLKSKRKKRMEKFNKGLPDMINTIIGSLRSGFSLAQAMKTVSEDCESPVREEIVSLLKELSYGVTMEEALDNLNKRVPSVDLELMIQAILIQRQVGGNLSNILEIIVNTIRQRYKLERQIKTMTAQGRLSGKIIAALPIVLGFILYLFNPESMLAFLGNTIGRIAIAVGVVSGIIGFIIINRITKIEV
jgi:tight adherence protein B